MLKIISPRLIFGFISFACVSLVAGGVVMAEFYGLRPCYLCNFQRLMYLLTAFFALCGVFFIRWRKIWSFLVAGVAAGGMATALWQSWIQFFPDKSNGCGVGEPDLLERVIDMLGEIWPDMFMVFGDCADDSWRFLGGSLANWSVLFFAGLIMTALYLFVRKLKA